MLLVMLWLLLNSFHPFSSDSSSYRIKTPKRITIAICQTKQTAGKLTRIKVLFCGPKKFPALSQQFPILMTFFWRCSDRSSGRVLTQLWLQAGCQHLIYCELWEGVWFSLPLTSKVCARVIFHELNHSLPAALLFLLKVGDVIPRTGSRKYSDCITILTQYDFLKCHYIKVVQWVKNSKYYTRSYICSRNKEYYCLFNAALKISYVWQPCALSRHETGVRWTHLSVRVILHCRDSYSI